MGKIVTLGKATRLVPYDCLTTTVKFQSSAPRTDAALRTVLKESEQFLTQLKDAGMDLSTLEAGSNTVWEARSEEEKRVYANRGIVFRTAYDPGFVDRLSRMIAENGYEAALDFSSEISNMRAIKNELFGTAAMNAKSSAEQVASAMGLKVVSLERIKTEESDRYRRNAFEDIEDIFSDGIGHSRNLSKAVTVEGGYSELSAPKTEVEVVVYAEWNVE